MGIEVVDEDGEEKRGQDTSLGDAGTGSEPVRVLTTLPDSKLALSEEGTHPSPSLSYTPCLHSQLIQQ